MGKEAKQKAVEIYNKLRDTASILEGNARTKQRGVILVNEVISTLQQLGEDLFDKQGNDSYNARCLNHDKKAFWKDVKSEMQNL